MRYWEVRPSPFSAMPDAERDRQISSLMYWLQSLRKDAWIHVILANEWVDAGDGRGWMLPIPRFYIGASPDDDPSRFMKAVAALPPERPWPVKGKSDMALLEDGSWAKAYVVARFPPEAFEALLSPSLLPYDELHLAIQPVQRAGGMLRRKAERMSRAGDQELGEAYQLLALEAQSGLRIHKILPILVVRGGSPSEVRDKSGELEASMDAHGLEYQSPSFLHAHLYALSLGRPTRILASSATISWLYPFSFDYLLDPGGVFLGVDLSTGAPVVYNVYARDNYNIVVIGETGSGKSVTAKVYARRFYRRYGYPLYIVDVEGEYAPVASRIAPGLGVVRVEPGRPAGLDPIRLARQGLMDPLQASEVLADFYRVPFELRGTLASLASRASSIWGLLEEAPRELRRYLEPAETVDRWVYEGDPPRVPREGVVFDISRVESRRHQTIIAGLLAGLLSHKLIAERQRALLLVDEGWRFAEFPALMDMYARASRLFRKRGVTFLFLTQRPADVLANESGRTILEQSQTVLLLRLSPPSIAAIRNTYQLTPQEEQALLEARPGEGILRVAYYRMRVKIQATEEELKWFSTTPMESAFAD